MKSIQITLLLLLICQYSCNSINEKTICSKYKNGDFKYQIPSKQSPTSVKIIRNDSLQTEIVGNTNDTSVLKVTWIDSCTYVLSYIKIISNEADSLSSFKKSITIKTSIVGGTDNYYLFESSNNKTDFILKDTIWVDR